MLATCFVASSTLCSELFVLCSSASARAAGKGTTLGGGCVSPSSSIDLDSVELDSLRFNCVGLSRFSPEIRREILGISGDFWETSSDACVSFAPVSARADSRGFSTHVVASAAGGAGYFEGVIFWLLILCHWFQRVKL